MSFLESGSSLLAPEEGIHDIADELLISDSIGDLLRERDDLLEVGCNLCKQFDPCRGVQFIPTGGISAANMVEYLSTPGVLAIGGSWIVAKDLIQSKDWDAVTRLTREAVGMIHKL